MNWASIVDLGRSVASLLRSRASPATEPTGGLLSSISIRLLSLTKTPAMRLPGRPVRAVSTKPARPRGYRPPMCELSRL